MLDRTGERRYAQELLAALSSLPGVAVEELALTRREATSGLARLAYQGVAEAMWYPVGLPRAARRRGVSLVHYPRHVFTPAVGLRVPSVVTIHDVFPLSHPDLYSRVISSHHGLLTGPAARSATRVVTGSEFSRAQIIEHTGVPPDRVVVTPYGVGAHFRPVAVADSWLEERFGITRPYVLCIGTLEPRKNLRAGLDAFERLDGDATLVLTGGRGWKNREFDERVSRFRGRLVLTGYLEDADLVRLLSAADCFLHPAHFEGFGFPVVEAMACGAPVVASDGGSLPEVVGDAGVTAPPTEPEALAEAMARVLGDAALRSELSARGRRRAASFTWQACAEATSRVYGDALACR
jgi:glycosyltransferase involved in cell wall biosynthesis